MKQERESESGETNRQTRIIASVVASGIERIKLLLCLLISEDGMALRESTTFNVLNNNETKMRTNEGLTKSQQGRTCPHNRILNPSFIRVPKAMASAVAQSTASLF
jgi:hypothetical protein